MSVPQLAYAGDLIRALKAGAPPRELARIVRNTEPVRDPVLFKSISGDLGIRGEPGGEGFAARPVVWATHSSTNTQDLHGTWWAPSALRRMLEQARGLTTFMNHRYDVPEDVFGTITEGTLIPRMSGGGEHHLDLDMATAVETENPRAVKSYRMINNGTHLGQSVGIILLDWEWQDPDGHCIGKVEEDIFGVADHERADARLTMTDLAFVESSTVGIPSNRRGWTHTPGTRQVDEGVFGWQLAAVQSLQRAGVITDTRAGPPSPQLYGGVTLPAERTTDVSKNKDAPTTPSATPAAGAAPVAGSGATPAVTAGAIPAAHTAPQAQAATSGAAGTGAVAQVLTNGLTNDGADLDALDNAFNNASGVATKPAPITTTVRMADGTLPTADLLAARQAAMEKLQRKAEKAARKASKDAPQTADAPQGKKAAKAARKAEEAAHALKEARKAEKAQRKAAKQAERAVKKEQRLVVAAAAPVPATAPTGETTTITALDAKVVAAWRGYSALTKKIDTMEKREKKLRKEVKRARRTLAKADKTPFARPTKRAASTHLSQDLSSFNLIALNDDEAMAAMAGTIVS